MPKYDEAFAGHLFLAHLCHSHKYGEACVNVVGRILPVGVVDLASLASSRSLSSTSSRPLCMHCFPCFVLAIGVHQRWVNVVGRVVFVGADPIGVPGV